MIAESLLRVNAELLENIMLSLNTCNGLIDIGQDCPLQKVLCCAFLDDASEYVFIKGLRNGFAFGFGVGDSLECLEEFLARIDYFDRNAELVDGGIRK